MLPRPLMLLTLKTPVPITPILRILLMTASHLNGGTSYAQNQSVTLFLPLFDKDRGRCCSLCLCYPSFQFCNLGCLIMVASKSLPMFQVGFSLSCIHPWCKPLRFLLPFTLIGTDSVNHSPYFSPKVIPLAGSLYPPTSFGLFINPWRTGLALFCFWIWIKGLLGDQVESILRLFYFSPWCW